MKKDKLDIACILDMACRKAIGISFPTDCILKILKRHKCIRKHRQPPNNPYIPEYNPRGARIKRLKTKTRIKRAWRFNNFKHT